MKLYKLLIIIIPFFCLSVYANSDNKKENIIFIIVDDLRDLTMADNQLQISTPNIDKLKKSGVTFKNSFTNNPVCGASRASLLTGLRPTKNRFTTFYTKINEDAPNSLTIASHLKNNGYRTISNGKISHHARDAAYGWDDIFRGTRNNPKDYKDPVNIKNLKDNFGPASEFVYTDDNDYSDGKVEKKT
ncbi:MAG: sulfatase-like hydrolase/transferase, partial [Flavobacteriaceae bacterium]|nr:sulfatase-like hydrolase/transferase [Flavobacteriaceae bacterium]